RGHKFMIPRHSVPSPRVSVSALRPFVPSPRVRFLDNSLLPAAYSYTAVVRLFVGRRRLRRLGFLSILVVLFACAVFAQVPSAQNKSEAEDFDARLGTDDGAAVALLIGGNQRGNLELCD